MMLDIWQQLQSFMGRGGPVLWVILALLVIFTASSAPLWIYQGF